jgi:hypothetical protein
MFGWMVVGPIIYTCFVHVGWNWRTRRAAGHARACLFRLQLVFKLVGLALIFRGGTKLDGAFSFYTTTAAACLYMDRYCSLSSGNKARYSYFWAMWRGSFGTWHELGHEVACAPSGCIPVCVRTYNLPTYTPHARAHISFHKKKSSSYSSQLEAHLHLMLL